MALPKSGLHYSSALYLFLKKTSQRHTRWNTADPFVFYLDDLIYVTLPERIESDDREHQRVSAQNYNSLGDLVGIRKCAGNGVRRDRKIYV